MAWMKREVGAEFELLRDIYRVAPREYASARDELIARFIGRNQTVAQNDDTPRVLRDVRFVRDHHDRLASVRQVFENSHDFFRRLRVEVSCRFVGQKDCRLPAQRASYGDALLLTS